MLEAMQPGEPASRAEQLTVLARMLGVELSADELRALARQLDTLEALEFEALQDEPPVLLLDADWHD